jgi:MoxR-like ATPase
MGQMKNNRKALQVIAEVRKAVIGKDEAVAKVMTAILAGGHILLEDIPGVGKTTMAVAFSKAMALQQNRVQFTPDVLPADIVGFSMYQKDTGRFVYQPGAVICNLFLADEINRTSPKTQSALLEVMEEGKITVDGTEIKVPEPFIVIATQNPFGSAGTQLLPESQVDRFMICMSMGYPDMKYEIEIVKGKVLNNPMDEVQPVMNGQELMDIRKLAEATYIHDAVYEYMGRLVGATRKHELIELGLSPRGTLSIAAMAKANAFLEGRDYVVPEDVQLVFPDVAVHRIRLNSKARINHVSVAEVIRQILEKTQKPTVRERHS